MRMKFPSSRVLLACGVLCAPAAFAAEPATGGPPQDERVAAYRDFRAAFDAGNYQAALPQAQQVVELTRSQFGADAQELANPLTNVGATYYRLKQYDAALDAFRGALKVLDAVADSADPRLVRPLFGLGLSLRALGRDEEAIVPLKRAVDITRNQEGLFSPAQLPLLRPLIAAYMNSARSEDAGREQQYAYTLAENTWGRNDVRLLQPLDELARWNETMGRYTMARMLHARAVQIADTAPGSNPVLGVDGLRGIARSYRMAFVYGEAEESIATANSAATTDSLLQRVAAAPSSEGERALRIALDRLRAAQPPDSRRIGAVQADLGDWYLTAGVPQRAMPMYRDAWNSLNSVGAAGLLATPVPLTYRPPSVAVSRGLQDPDRNEQQDVDLRLSIDATGRVREAVVTNPSPQRESVERAVVSALRRAQFRPAIEGGEAVATGDTPFSERVWVRLPDPDKPAR
jgi:TonB family protein